eukprot:513771-Pelagomonas_calceolata.AAC.2
MVTPQAFVVASACYTACGLSIGCAETSASEAKKMSRAPALSCRHKRVHREIGGSFGSQESAAVSGSGFEGGDANAAAATPAGTPAAPAAPEPPPAVRAYNDDDDDDDDD